MNSLYKNKVQMEASKYYAKTTEYYIRQVSKKEAKEIIIKNHYTHKWSSCRYALGLFREDKIVGVAVYGFPVGRRVVKSISPILENRDVLELTRLWVEDGTGGNAESFFIGRTFDWIRRNTDIKCLISYSDPMHGHVGVIYQATNWLYQGNSTMLVKGYMYVINGQTYHPRSVVAKFGSTKNAVLLDVDPDYKKIEMKKKHRYLYIINKRHKKEILSSLKHPILPYPKNNDNCDWKQLTK